MNLIFSGHPFQYEMENLVRIFLPGVKISASGDDADTIFTRVAKGRTRTTLYVRIRLRDKYTHRHTSLANTTPDYESTCERLLSICLYRALAELTEQRPKWGILTGIRPVKLLRSLSAGRTTEELAALMTRDYLVTEEKLSLAADILHTQERLLTMPNRSFSLYVSIPFCPTRCSYCSFVAHSLESAKRLIPAYVEKLCEELAAIGKYARELSLTLDTVYFGGGTPTSLSAEELSAIMEAIARSFDLSTLREYTVEAGRPDTVTLERMQALRAHGCTRISVNPQTMHDDILRTIGRGHTAAQTVEAFRLARGVGFDSINMDLIAGLPGDTPERFADTLEQVLALSPDDVTVHTLTRKRSSDLYAEDVPEDAGVAQMVDHAAVRLREAGFLPYYLYRQKNTVGNLENVGYARPGKEGLYNVLIMEEVQTILAAGAAGSTKLVQNGRIERIFNHKFPYEYLSRFDEILSRKERIRTFFTQPEETR